MLQSGRSFPRDRLLLPAARLGRVHTAARHPGDDRCQGVQSPSSSQRDAHVFEEAGRLSQCSVYKYFFADILKNGICLMFIFLK